MWNWKGAAMIIVFRWMPQIYFFQIPNLNKLILFVGWSGSCAPGDEKAKK